MTVLCIVFAIIAIVAAVCAISFNKSEMYPALVMAAMLFGVGAGVTGTISVKNQEPQALDVYRGKTVLLVPTESGDNDSIVVWKKDVEP